MKYIVDRISAGIAVCEREDETMVRFPLSVLPLGTKEGSVLLEEYGVFSLQQEETDERRQALFEMQNALFGDEEENVASAAASAGGDSEDDDFFSYFDEDE